MHKRIVRYSCIRGEQKNNPGCRVHLSARFQTRNLIRDHLFAFPGDFNQRIRICIIPCRTEEIIEFDIK